MRNTNKPLFASRFEIPTVKKINSKLIFGSALFGVGWGMVGLCPGPAISAMAFLDINVYLFIFCMFFGFYLGKLFQTKKQPI